MNTAKTPTLNNPRKALAEHPYIIAAINSASERVGHRCKLRLNKSGIGLQYEHRDVTFIVGPTAEETSLLMTAFGDVLGRIMDEAFKAGSRKPRQRRKR